MMGLHQAQLAYAIHIASAGSKLACLLDHIYYSSAMISAEGEEGRTNAQIVHPLVWIAKGSCQAILQ